MRLRNSLPFVVMLLALLPSRARAQVDVIRGHVTNAEGLPLGGVRVTATSIPGNVTRSARSDAKGGYQIAFPGGQGDYMMGFSLVGYAFRQYEIKRTVDQDVLVADARLASVQLDTIVTVAPVQQRVSRNATTPDVGGTERAIANSLLPLELQGNLAAMAASLPGVTLIPGTDGGADGFSVLGLGADQNSVTLNGMQMDANGLPRDASMSTSLTTSPYDPSRGGFSGGQFNIKPGAGSNYKSRGMSFVGNAPQLMWTDRAAQSLGAEYTNMSLGGMASGPIKQNKSFYNVSYQLGRQQSDLASLLSTTSLGFQTAGLAYDSVSHFLTVLRDRSVPMAGGPTRGSRLTDNGSAFGSFDITPPNSQSGSSYNIAFNGGWGRQSPTNAGPTQLLSSSGDRINWNGGIQARHNAYLGLILSETQVGFSTSTNYGDPYLQLPSGRVRVNSDLENGTSGVQTLTFGGAQGFDNRSSSTSTTIQNTLSWFDDANKHRIKLSSEFRYAANTQYTGSNLLGTFTFNSIEDLDAGRPSSFSRQLTARERSTGQMSGSMSIGDSWRKSPNVQIQYGLRVDGNHFTNTPTYNPEVEQVFGRRNDHVPNPLAYSPRIGFSWTLGSSQEIGAFTGAFRGPRSVIRGGIGMFANAASTGVIGSALDNTGLPSGVQQIYCVGAAAPSPDWNAYLDPSHIPTSCADGTNGTVFSNTAPSVVLFGKDFAPQRSIRSNLAWSGSILDARFSTSVEGTFALNLKQQRTVDLNFDGVTRFSLPSEQGRPVFVNESSIVPTTGFIASRDARISQSFQRVSEYRSDLRSQTAQLSVRLAPIPRTPTKFRWNAAYTLMDVREQVSGFNSTASNPLRIDWSSNSQGPHQINYTLGYNFFNYVQVSWNGQFRSGAAFTPLVAGDINGDGYSNDRAFIYNPDQLDAQDADLASNLRELLASSPDATRDCLTRQMGHIAARNSCRAPWSSSASLNITLDRVKFRMPQRASVSFSLSNPLGAADLALHGSGKLKGWGQTPFPEQALLYVRGFDPVAKRYQYEVNRRFGATRPQNITLRSPVTLTLSMKYDLGPTRERQSLVQQLESNRRSAGTGFNMESSFRSSGVSALLNPMSTILRSQDSLRLTSIQADSIAVMNRRYTYRADSLWTPVARYLAKLGDKYNPDEAYDRYITARHAQLDMLEPIGRAIRELLTPEQRRKLPASVTNWLDPLFLASIRNGSGMYVGGGTSGGIFLPNGMSEAVFTQSGFTIIR